MIGKLWLLSLGFALLAGCGVHVSTDPPVAGPADGPAPASVSCPPDLFRRGGHVPAPHGGVPAGFRTAWVLRCRDGTEHRTGLGEWDTAITERADTDAPVLLRALRRSGPVLHGVCTLDLRGVPYFALVDATGKAIRPAVARDTCGHPSAPVVQALDALPFRTIAVRPLRQQRTESEVTAGCAGAYKDLFTSQTPVPAPARPLWPERINQLHICVYGHITGGNIPVGRFSTGRIVRGVNASHLVSTLDNAGAAPNCSLRHTGFVLVVPRSGTTTGLSVLLEMDGCHRMLRPDGTLARLDAATVRQIVRAGGQ